MSYKKRARAGWQEGKYAKKQANRCERMHEKKEISQELHEHEAGDNFRYKFKSREKVTERLRLAKHIKWAEHLVDKYSRENMDFIDYLGSSMSNWAKTLLKKYKKKWKDKYEKK